ncbi:uncharacterized protein LOC119724324 [Patiria miniata]|uniref:Uncharacterized protein n=1 Tax=Patiria miniata TaxID=46514 RepID=A0A913ZHI4_PATMI|nr:uncharacterized protein LOC119724324 [Patiria miniata]
MGSLRSVTLLLVCFAAVGADEPTPCCVPKRYTIKLVEVTNDLVDGVVTSLEQNVHQAYDATNELRSEILWQYDADTGVTETSKTIYLYPQATKYVIKDGKCTKEALTEKFLELCVPQSAHFVNTFTFGLGDFANNLFSLAVPAQSYDNVYDFVVGTENCIPYIFSSRRAPPSGSARAPSAGPVSIPLPFNQSRLAVGADAPLSVRSQYFDYEEGIADPSFWFKPPPECQKLPTDEQKASAKKMAGRLMAKFKGKNFVAI